MHDITCIVIFVKLRCELKSIKLERENMSRLHYSTLSMFKQNMSHVIRKPSFCIYAISAFIFATLIVQSLYFLNGCTARLVSDLVGNPEDWFSHDAARIAGTLAMPLDIASVSASKSL